MPRLVLWVLALLMIAPDAPASLKSELTFLTRDGCVYTPEMLNNVDDALRSLHWPTDYAYINIRTLSETDVRTAYPTPTLLWKGHDIFGMPAPQPPYAVPS